MFLFNYEFLPWLDVWMLKHKKHVFCFGAVICGLGSFILTKSPPVFNLYITAALICHYLISGHPPSITCTLAYNIDTILLVSANAIENYLEMAHFVDFKEEQIGLVAASVLIVFGLKCCELCGNWEVERYLIKRIELCVIGICLYAISMGVLPSSVGDFWRYMVALLAGTLVFNGSIWLNAEEVGQLTHPADEKVEKGGVQTT